MDQEIINKLDRAKSLTADLTQLIQQINLLMKQASDIGLNIHLNKEQMRNGDVMQTVLELRHATVNLEFIQKAVKFD